MNHDPDLDDDEGLDEDEVDLDAWSRMQCIDSMPPEWRALVHDYGWLIVLKVYADVQDEEPEIALRIARLALKGWREGKQKEAMSDDYVLDRTASKGAKVADVAAIRKRAAGLS